MLQGKQGVSYAVIGCFIAGIAGGAAFLGPSTPVEVASEMQPTLAVEQQEDAPEATLAADTTAFMSTAHRRAMFRQIGTASWYGKAFEGKPMANTLPFKRKMLTAAHRTLPLGTKLRIVNLDNGNVVEVTVTDRGPYVPGRVIDLSEKAAERLGMRENGLATVSIETIEPARLG